MHIQRLAPSHAPVFLVNSRYPLACAAPRGSAREARHPRGPPLCRRHGSVLPSSLTRISPIALVCSTRPPVSVWVRAACHLAQRLFSATGTTGFAPQRRPSSHLGRMPGGFACRTARMLDHGKPPPRPAPPSRHPNAALLPGRVPPATPRAPRRTRRTGTGVSTPGLGRDGRKPVGEYPLLRPFDYACRPRLRTRLTQGRQAWPWNPRSSGARDTHPRLATHVYILTPQRSTAGLRRRFAPQGTLSYPAGKTCRRAFGGVLEPRYIVGAGPLDQ